MADGEGATIDLKVVERVTEREIMAHIEEGIAGEPGGEGDTDAEDGDTDEDGGGEAVANGAGVDVDVDVPEPDEVGDVGVGDDADEEDDDEPAATGAGVGEFEEREDDADWISGGDIEAAKSIIGEHEIDRTEFMVWFNRAQDFGYTQDEASELWSALRDRELVPPPPETDDEGDDEDEGADEGADEDTGSMDVDVPDTAPAGVTDDQMSMIDGIYLLVMEECIGCGQAEDALSEHIEAGAVEVLDVQESDLGADIAVDLNLTAMPSLVLEAAGEYREL